MALYVNTNVSSINGQNNLTQATNSLTTTYQRLSSGLRINSAKDDAAGLQISNRLTTQINGLEQGNRNANDGIALAQTMEGAMEEMSDMLQRIRTLAVQSANGTNTTADRVSIQSEVNQLSAEITRIACETTYGGRSFLNYDGSQNKTQGNSLLSVDGSAATVRLHVGANEGDTITINMGTGSFTMAGLISQAGATGDNILEGKVDDDGSTYTALSVSTADNAELTISTIDEMINIIDAKRGDLGAIENRLESTITNQSNVAENETDARSRIQDTDYAEEASNLTQQQTIQQAATTILTQANAQPEIALSLLQG